MKKTKKKQKPFLAEEQRLYNDVSLFVDHVSVDCRFDVYLC